MLKMEIDDNASIGRLLYEVQALRQDIDTQNKLTEELLDKINNLEDKMDKQGAILKRLITTEKKVESKENSKMLKLFPIASEKHLIEVEKIVEITPKEKVMNYLKQELLNVKKSKIFSIIFTEDMLLQVNWSGVKHKLPLNRRRLFTEHIFECLKTVHMSFDRFEDMMKRSLLLGKNYIYKKVHKQKIEN